MKIEYNQHWPERLPSGFPQPKWIQAEVINSILSGHDTLALLPTGTGKSLCFQIPGVILQKPTLVITPLLALMQDQVASLQNRGQRSLAWNSLSPAISLKRLVDDLQSGQYQFLYLSPEKLALPGVCKRLTEVPWGLLVVDEAHCVRSWGESFRPQYLALGPLLTELQQASGAVRFACTATATPETISHIITTLQLQNPKIIALPSIRANLDLAIAAAPSDQAAFQLLFRTLQHWWDTGSGTGLIYVSSRISAEALAQRLHRCGLPCQAFHAGLSSERKKRLIEKFCSPTRSIFVATCALGMGVDQPSVRLVIHAESPTDLESYAQEVGRAGRDGLSAHALWIYRRSQFLKTIEHRKAKEPKLWPNLRQQAREVMYLAEGNICIPEFLVRNFQHSAVPPVCVTNCRCSRCIRWSWRLDQA